MVYRPRITRWQLKKILLLHSFCALKNNYCQRQTLWYRQNRLLARPPPTPSPIRNSHERLPAPSPPTCTPHTGDHRTAHLPASDFIRIQQLLKSQHINRRAVTKNHRPTDKQTDTCRNTYIWKLEFKSGGGGWYQPNNQIKPNQPVI